MDTSDRLHRLIYLRHGETEWSLLGRHTGASDIPLTEVGLSQARALQPVVATLALASPTVWVSPRARAARTAELAGLTGLADVVVKPELAEWDYGSYEGRTSPEIRVDNPGWSVWDSPTPGGESIDQVAARADHMLAQVRSAMAGGDVVLVGHGHFGRVLIARFLGADPRFGRHLPLLPASVAVGGVDHDSVPQLQHFGITGYQAASYQGR